MLADINIYKSDVVKPYFSL